MNVKVETVDVPDGTGKIMRKKILTVLKDFKAGDVIYKVAITSRLIYQHSLSFSCRNILSSPSSTLICKQRELIAHTAYGKLNLAWSSSLKMTGCKQSTG